MLSMRLGRSAADEWRRESKNRSGIRSLLPFHGERRTHYRRYIDKNYHLKKTKKSVEESVHSGTSVYSLVAYSCCTKFFLRFIESRRIWPSDSFVAGDVIDGDVTKASIPSIKGDAFQFVFHILHFENLDLVDYHVCYWSWTYKGSSKTMPMYARRSMKIFSLPLGTCLQIDQRHSICHVNYRRWRWKPSLASDGIQTRWHGLTHRDLVRTNFLVRHPHFNAIVDLCLSSRFITRTDSSKVPEIRKNNRVNVAFSDPAHQSYVSINGQAQVVNDKSKAKELWSPYMKAWSVHIRIVFNWRSHREIGFVCRFPQELDDPHLGLIKVTIEGAEFWDSASSLMVRAVGYVKAALGNPSTLEGENKKVSFP